MKCRYLNGDDLLKVGEIANYSFDDYSAEDFLKMSQDKNYRFVVAEKNKEILGFVIFLVVDEKIEIIKIATSVHERRSGVASEMLRFVQCYGKQNGHAGVILEVNEHNTPARKLYLKMGFREIYVRKKYYHNTDDAIIMEWVN